MGFGAVITSGPANTPLGDDLVQWLVEARVEQELSAPTRFAIRFEEDTCEGKPAVLKAAEIKPNTLIAILAPAGNGVTCLVRGPVTQVKFSVQLGVAGSWVEIHGEDRRVELDRACIQAAWRGLASTAATRILAAYGFVPDVQATTKLYADTDHTLNQSGSDLSFIEQIARENGFELWIEYGRNLPAPLPGAPIAITETALLKPSPPRGATPGVAVLLAPPSAPTLRVNVPPDQCPNVTAVQVNTDVERPNAAKGAAVDPRTGRLDRTQATDPQPGVGNGPRLVQIDGVKRELCVTTAGGADELQGKQEAALIEAGWFVEVTASTTAHMLGGVLKPHDVVPIDGIGDAYSGPYQVKSVTHVINAADHFMELRLRSNIGNRD
ncbi:hypothetical protein [Limobrevibacterium gyesilva]|uniref:Phage protein D n=1 Tax=Limobrevibacterium gyesilva TaxID=2991712 RepID=A0AA41YTT7_9PROT|nr:hypothetical protein [Limobrevibacterium gyesilva]MCW3475302.1 hypothetical protein [Limobrevibacterium gyesilva]